MNKNMPVINSCITKILSGLLIFPLILGAGENGDGPPVFLGKALPHALHHRDAHSIRDLFVEDVPGTKSYWQGPWVETVAVDGIDRFYIIKGYNRFYVDAAFLGDPEMEFRVNITGIPDFYGPFEGKPSDHFALQEAGQGEAGAPESKSEGDGDLLDAGEFVEVTSGPTFATKPRKDLPGFERLLDRITIEPSSGSSPSSFIVSGRVVSGNTGSPLERISVYIGSDGGKARLAGLTNVDGKFKFRLWIKEDHRDLEIQVPKDFSGYLYVGGSAQTISVGQSSLTASGLTQTSYRRYPLQRLRELAKAQIGPE